MVIQPVVNIAAICARKNIEYAVISPGSRSALLTLAFARHPDIKTFVVYDERSAAFIAMGLAQQSQKPVALICTSGTAAINYYPAITEAFYQNIPLLVLTADRPQEWIDQQDGQTIRQFELYKNHIKHSYQLPNSYDNKDDEWRAYRTLNEAINCSIVHPTGPVHINVPIREPFYPEKDEKIDFDSTVPIIESVSNARGDKGDTEKIIQQITAFKKILIVAGQQNPDIELINALNIATEKYNLPVIADIISNASSISNAVRHQDAFIKYQDQSLQPDLLITFGRSVISKQLKLYLRKFKPQEHWHLSYNDYPADTFQSLTKIIDINPISFFKYLNELSLSTNDSDYLYNWLSTDKIAADLINNIFSSKTFGEFEAVKTVIGSLPKNSTLHLANSMPVRYANFINLKKQVNVFSNRGTSGIDGCVGTAVGHALHSKNTNILITGDMAFFYDRNALWHQHIPDNLRIIILNNYGGGIFRLIDGPAQLPELDEYFETHQSLNAKNTASDYGLDYYICRTREELNSALPQFFEPGSAKILEIETNKNINQEVYKSFNKTIKEAYGA